MKSLRKIQKSELFEVFVPLADTESQSELFDDCALCRDLKEAMARTKRDSVPIQIEVFENVEMKMFGNA